MMREQHKIDMIKQEVKEQDDFLLTMCVMVFPYPRNDSCVCVYL